jgi:acetyl-CoA/propionyl-CoA carboxylase biotin carboxyl carrier protein
VAEGDTICVLEAMKMENNILADKAGTISQLKVEPGQSVGAGDPVATIS